MLHRIAQFPMTFNDLQRHAPELHALKCDSLQICAAFGDLTRYQPTPHRTVPVCYSYTKAYHFNHTTLC